MEEARQLLGERVPGFHIVLADALEVTVPELFSSIEAGRVTKLDAIEALARAKIQADRDYTEEHGLQRELDDFEATFGQNPLRRRVPTDPRG